MFLLYSQQWMCLQFIVDQQSVTFSIIRCCNICATINFFFFLPLITTFMYQKTFLTISHYFVYCSVVSDDTWNVTSSIQRDARKVQTLIRIPAFVSVWRCDFDESTRFKLPELYWYFLLAFSALCFKVYQKSFFWWANVGFS